MGNKIWVAEYFGLANADGTFAIKEIATAESRNELLQKLEEVEDGKYTFYDFYDDTNKVVIFEDGSEDSEGYDSGALGQLHISEVAA